MKNKKKENGNVSSENPEQLNNKDNNLDPNKITTYYNNLKIEIKEKDNTENIQNETITEKSN